MARVEVAVAPDVVVGAPRAGAALHLLHLAAQVVNVGRLAVQQLADDALTDHVEVEQFLPPVAHVLHVHAVAGGLLGRVHELPHLVEGDGDRRLDEHVGAGLHGGHAHGRVGLPGGGDDDHVRLHLGEHRPVEVRVAEVELRFVTLGHDALLGPLGEVLVEVADRNDLGALDRRELRRVAAAAGAHADHGDADLRDLRRGEVAHVLRAGPAGRCRGLAACESGQRGHRGGGAAERLDEGSAFGLVRLLRLHCPFTCSVLIDRDRQGSDRRRCRRRARPTAYRAS